jgi:DNA-binding cell septation regulator SpoVG
MQMAVRAKNFKIPMDVLAKGLQFATKRAVETGESVDYLVESFVIGLGRESVKILDNLGISTLEIQRKTKELGDMTTAVGAIMDEEFAKGGERVETTSMKIDQQRAAVTNLKTEIGEKLAPVYMGVVQGGLEFVKALTNTFEQFSEGYSKMFRLLFNLRSEQDRFGKSISDTGKKRIESEEKSLFRLNAMLNSLKDSNLAEDQRAILIKKINTEYKDYLPNLLSEKTTLEEIRDVSRQVNKTAREKINQIIFQEKINKATEDGVQAQKDLNDLTIEQSQMIARGGSYAMTAEQLRELAETGQNLGHDFNTAASRVVTMNNALDDARNRFSTAEMIIEGYTKMLNGSSDATENFGEKTEGTKNDVDGLGDSLDKTHGYLMNMAVRMADMSETAPLTFAAIAVSMQPVMTEGQKMQNLFMGISQEIGQTLAQSFEAAIMNGESFFTVFADGLKAMLAQILAVVAATAVLALVLALTPLGVAGLSAQSFGTAFKMIGGGMGVPSFAMPGGMSGNTSGGIEIFGKLLGSDILLSGERAGRNRNRLSGIGG